MAGDGNFARSGFRAPGGALRSKVFEAVARTPAEAIRFLLCNFPELRSIMGAGHYTVAVGTYVGIRGHQSNWVIR